MLRLSALACIIFLAAAQDPAAKVEKLVEQLGAEDIVEREKASAELVKLGPSILETLLSRLPKLEGETNRRVYAIIRKIERDHKVAERVLRAPRVTIPARTLTLGEALEEIRKQTGMPIEAVGIPADSRIKIDLNKVSFWKALEEVCKTHGGVMYTVAARRAIVEAVPYRELPRVHHGGVLFFLDHFLVDQYSPGEGAHITLKPVVGWAPGASPLSYKVETEAMKDDLGTDLTGGQAPHPWIFIGPRERESIGGALYYHGFGGLVPAEAKTIAVWKGKLHLRFALDLKKAASIADPLTVKSGSAGSDDGRIELQSVRTKDRNVLLRVVVSTPLEKDADAEYHNLGLANLLVLTDAKGNMIRGRGEGAPRTGGVNKERGWATRTLQYTFEIPAGAEVASVDLMIPSDTQDAEIPFEFKDLRFRGAGK